MKVLNYLKDSFIQFTFLVPRFNYTEFVAHLNNMLGEGKTEKIEKIFANKEYEELWKYERIQENKFTEKDKKQYLNCFKEFLILDNQ